MPMGLSLLMLRQVFAVIAKEVLDARRDIKAIMPALFMPVLFAGMTYGSIWFFVSLQNQPRSFELAVAGAERAVPLMKALQEAGIKVVEAPEDPAEAVRAGKRDMVLIVPDDFNEQFRSQKSASLDLIWDVSRMDSHAHVNQVKQYIHQWSATAGALRLLLRGVSPQVSQVLVVNDINVASDQQMVSKMLAGLPMVILLLAFVSGAGMCSEMAAGERENNTMEPLLITPVAEHTLFAGKWLAAILVTLVIAIAGVALQLLSVNVAPTDELGLSAKLGFTEFTVIVLVLIPVVFLATALQLLVSFLSKSFKDAQSYNQLLMLVPVLPGLYVLLSNTGSMAWKMWVPLLGPQLLIVDVFSGESIHWLHLLIASVTSIACALLCSLVAVRLMRRE